MLKNKKGFTVIEVMVVVACLAILSAICVPGWIATGRPALRLKNATKQVVSDTRYARMRAVATNRQYRLRFDPLADTYLLERGDLPTGSASWIPEGSPRRFGLNGGSSFAGVHIEGDTQYSIVFRPTGTVTSNTVTLKNSLDRTRKVVCSMAGRVRIIKEQ
jgi:prepilin-type N-terminal cleavage/methylation domain-containing protein